MEKIYDKILVALGSLEEKNNISILYAVESGSRLWGFDDESSDYDIRFIYRKPLIEYHRIDKGSDCVHSEYDELDLLGFDAHKFMSLLFKSNPTVVEWVKSPIIYYHNGYLQHFFKYIEDRINLHTLGEAYYGLAKSNYEKYISQRPEHKVKKELYVLRGLFNVVYISGYDKLPPLDFDELVVKTVDRISEFNLEDVKKILDRKGKDAFFDSEYNLKINSLLDRCKKYSEHIKRVEFTDNDKDLFNHVLWSMIEY